MRLIRHRSLPRWNCGRPTPLNATGMPNADQLIHSAPLGDESAHRLLRYQRRLPKAGSAEGKGMYRHAKKLMDTLRVGQADPRFGNMTPEGPILFTSRPRVTNSILRQENQRCPANRLDP